MNPLRMISTSIVAALIAAACLASSPSLASSQRPATSGTILTMTSLESPNVTNAPSSAKVPTVPKAKIEPVVDNYHGHKVTDPYRWLEDSHSPETQKFVEEENVYTQSRLDSLPLRQQLHARIESLATIGRIDVPRSAGKYYFHEAREGRQNQPVVYVREGVNGHDRPLVDVNSLAPDGTIALDWWHASDDGAYVAYGTSPNGSEISTLQVIETATGNLLPEQIGRTRAADVAWLPDNSGFYYTRYPRPGDVPAGQEMYNRRVFLHKLGGAGNMDGLKDPLIFGEGLDPEHWPHVSISKDGRWLLIKVSEGWTKEELFLKDLAQPQSKFAAVTQNKDFLYGTTIADGQLYIMTNEGAPRYRIFRVSCANPERSHWEEVLPEGQGVMQSMRLVGGKLFVHYFENAHSTLSVFELPPSTGHDQNAGRKIARHIKDVELPALGSITGLEGKLEGNEVFFGFSSYALPQTVYRLSLEGKLAEWARLKADVDPSAYEVKQVWFPSKDGVRVPMFVVHKKGLVLNGKNPTMLSGYGGFNVGRTPAFNRSSMLVLLDHGGVYADVQLRGGSEFGASWHRAGMLEKKQNVFDDFIAAAEYLIAEKYTDSGHLAIQGGSNGGLLMGAALTQRPDLFRAVVCQVPLLDMLRYQKFQIAKLWIPEYGSSDDPQQFDWLYAYSPYQHVKAGTVYPATLLMTADSDTRVDPMHAKKMTALLQAQAANGPDRPILLKVDTKAGHGAGKPVGKQIEENVDVWSFVFWQLGVQ